MGHETSALLLFDILYDFPVNAIVQRVGLLETLFDIIGSAVVGEERGRINLHFSPNILSIDHSSHILTPILLMEWFEMLLERSQIACQQIIEGTMTCNILESNSQYYESIDSARMVCFSVSFI